jgi:hypothetical protein
MANIKELILSIEAVDSSFDEKLAAINQMEETLVAMRQQEEQAVQDNVDLIVEAIRVMERKVENQLEIAKSIVPEKGDKGDKGDRGLDGVNGRDGKDGRDGINGRDGQDGKDGVSVTDAKIDFDGSLVITLSTGQEINVGEVVTPDLQEKIKLVTSGGAGTVLPDQTGNSGKVLGTNGSTLSWVTGGGGGGSGTVTSVAATVPTGLSISGSPITSSGTLAISYTAGYSIPTTSSQTNWDTAYTDRLKWDGGSTGLVAATARTSLGLVIGTDVLAPTGSAASLTSFPTFNQNTTGTASNVTGTVSIGNGGTGQTTKTAAFDALSPATTKGDLIAYDGTDNIRIPVGTDTYVLTADSTQASGLAWAAGGGGGGGLTQAQALKLVSLRL